MAPELVWLQEVKLIGALRKVLKRPHFHFHWKWCWCVLVGR
jgi:hypothetical protein